MTRWENRSDEKIGEIGNGSDRNGSDEKIVQMRNWSDRKLVRWENWSNGKRVRWENQVFKFDSNSNSQLRNRESLKIHKPEFGQYCLFIIIQCLPIKYWWDTWCGHTSVSTTSGLCAFQPIRSQTFSQVIEQIHWFYTGAKIALDAFLSLFVKKPRATAAVRSLKEGFTRKGIFLVY